MSDEEKDEFEYDRLALLNESMDAAIEEKDEMERLFRSSGLYEEEDGDISGDPLIHVEIVDYKIKQDAIKKFVSYELVVSTNELTWTVYRRFSEFSRMYSDLKRQFRKRKVPKFPEPSMSEEFRGFFKKKSLQKDFINKRIKGLDRFIRNILEDTRLASSMPFLEFIGALEDHSRKDNASWDYPKRKMHVDDYLKVADAGDVILFKTPGMVSSAYRSLVGSRWDHVAMVVYNYRSDYEFDDYRRLRLLEATVDGVHLYPLASRLYIWANSYHNIEIAARKLNCSRDEEFKQKMNDFTQKTVGKNYSLSGFFSKNERRQSELDEHIERESWFCSELVGMCYKYLGIIDAAKSPSVYQPFSFAKSSKQLNMMNSSLGEILALQFSRLQVSHANVNPQNLKAKGSRFKKINDDYKSSGDYSSPNCINEASIYRTSSANSV